MFRPYMMKLPIWSVGTHLELRAPLLVPDALRPHPKHSRHWQNYQNFYGQRSFTSCSSQFCKKYCSLFGSPGQKEIYQTNLGVTRTDKERLWKLDVAALTTSRVETLELLDGVKVKYHITHKAIKDEHFRNALLKQENYQKYFLTLMKRKEWNQYYSEMISAKSVLSNFDKVLTKYFIEHKKEPHNRLNPRDFAHYNYLLKKGLTQLEIHEIWCLTRHFFDITKKEKTTDLFKKLALVASTEILSRLNTLSSEQVFKTADMLFMVGMYRKNLLMKGLLRRMMNQDTTEQRVLFFFYLGLEGVSMAGVSDGIGNQHDLMKLSENLDINEVGIICNGLFKAMVKLHYENFGLFLLEKLEGNFDLHQDISAAAICKFLCHTIDKRLPEKFPDIYKRLTDRNFTSKLAQFVSDVKIRELGTSSVFYIFRLYSGIHVSPELLINCVAEKLKIEDESGQIRKLRLKDLSELAIRFAKFSNDDKSSRRIFQLITDEAVGRQYWGELQIYRPALSSLLYALSQEDIYPFELIKLLFDEGYTSLPGKLEDLQDIDFRYMYSVSESVKIERPEYDGPLFEESFADTAPKRQWYQREIKRTLLVGKVREPTQRNQFTSAAEEALECYFGDSKYFRTQIFLPHFLKHDIGFAVNETGDVIPASEWITNEGQIKQDTSIRRIAICLELERDALFTHMDRDGNISKRICGPIKMKFRQMKKQGFEVVPIFYDEFNSCENKQELLEEKIPPFVRKSAKKIVTTT